MFSTLLPALLTPRETTSLRPIMLASGWLLSWKALAGEGRRSSMRWSQESTLVHLMPKLATSCVLQLLLSSCSVREPSRWLNNNGQFATPLWVSLPTPNFINRPFIKPSPLRLTNCTVSFPLQLACGGSFPIMGNFLEGNPAVLMWSPSGSVTTNAVPLHLVIMTYTPGFENRAFRLRFCRLLLLHCPGSKGRKAVFSASFYWRRQITHCQRKVTYLR